MAVVTKTLTGHTRGVFSVAWSPDGNVLASGSVDNTIKLWNPVTNTLLRTLTGHSKCITSVAWSPAGDVLASGSGGPTIKLW